MSDKENRPSPSETAAIAQWERPELARFAARDAETAAAPLADGVTLS
jgi:hypothetical protein